MVVNNCMTFRHALKLGSKGVNILEDQQFSLESSEDYIICCVREECDCGIEPQVHDFECEFWSKKS